MRNVAKSIRCVAVALAFANLLAFARAPVLAHGASCEQMGVALGVMQREVDGLRASAKTYGAQAIRLRRAGSDPSKALAAAKFTNERADVEQNRTNGLRHNVAYCSRHDDDDDHDRPDTH